MTKAIVTFGSGKYAELLDIARPSYRAFAQRHGYDYFEAQVGQARPAPWYKVRCLQDLLKSGYDVAAFFGCDMVITDGRDDFGVPDGYAQAMVAHQTGDGHVPNTDMWIVYQSMLPWLDKCWALVGCLMHGWWEQAALLELMGYEPDIRPTYCRDITNPLYQATYWLDPGWNVHIWDAQPSERKRIMHATMYQDRAAIMRQWAQEAQEGWIQE